MAAMSSAGSSGWAAGRGGGTHFVGRSTQGRVPIRIVGFSTSVPRGAGRIRRCHVAALVLCRENDKLPRGRS